MFDNVNEWKELIFSMVDDMLHSILSGLFAFFIKLFVHYLDKNMIWFEVPI